MNDSACRSRFASPDFSIYSEDLVAVDPAGVHLNGLASYKNAFRLVHAVINLFYCPEKSVLTNRLVYDTVRDNIRVCWNAEVVPKAIFGKSALYVDGISVYQVSRTSGKIVQHRVEKLLINDAPVQPQRGIVHALRKELIDPECVPAFHAENSAVIAKFQNWNPLIQQPSLFSEDSSPSSTSIEAMSNVGDMESGSSDAESTPESIDMDALERKNKSRKKFGLKPLTTEEFIELQTQVREMERQADLAARIDAAEVPKKKGFLEGLFGDALEDTCTTNWDCQRPEVCCDFGFKKQCCSSGAMIPNVNGPPVQKKRQLARVIAGYPPQNPEDGFLPPR